MRVYKSRIHIDGDYCKRMLPESDQEGNEYIFLCEIIPAKVPNNISRRPGLYKLMVIQRVAGITCHKLHLAPYFTASIRR